MALIKLEIDSSRCKSCGLCVSVCPKSILEIGSGTFNEKGYSPAYIAKPGGCIGCKNCAVMCPESAIRIEKLGEEVKSNA